MNKKVELLLERPQPVQLTKEWFNARKNKITASAVGSLLVRDQETCKKYVELYDLDDTFDYDNRPCNPYSNKQQFAFEKYQQIFKGSPATFWGQRYESIASDIYSLMNKVKVLEFGLISHETLDWLAASPDGITEEGIMLEIKCPYRRKITGIPPLYYYQQVQIQLEVTDLDYCDFLEIEFREVLSMTEFLDDSIEENNVHYRGLYIQIEEIPDLFETREYIYPEKELINNPRQLNKWASNKMEDIISSRDFEIIKHNESDNITVKTNNYRKMNIKVVYWKAITISSVRIQRDQEWFNNIKGFLKSQWDDVVIFKSRFGCDYVPETPDSCMFNLKK